MTGNIKEEGGRVRVLVVDDSAYNRKTISDMIESSDLIEVVGTAVDGEDAIKRATELKPDVITLDLEMPRMDGFTFLRIMMSNFPTPTLVISSRDEDDCVFKALELGAADFIGKPTHHASEELLHIRDELVEKLLSVRSMNIGVVGALAKVQGLRERPLVEEEVVDATSDGYPMVAIGSSTGGPAAVQVLLAGLPGDLNAAVAISQHMPAGFTRSFSERLNKYSSLTVIEAKDGSVVRPGSVLVAPGGYNLSFERRDSSTIVARVELAKDDKFIPSVDMMFRSASKIFGSACLGVVLTGMGSDGKVGVRAIKDSGGYVIAQSEETSVIFGMPREAIATGVVDKVLPLEEIAAKISYRCALLGSAK